MTKRIATATVPTPNTWNNNQMSSETFTNCQLDGWVNSSDVTWHAHHSKQGDVKKIWPDCTNSTSKSFTCGDGDVGGQCYAESGSVHGIKGACFYTEHYGNTNTFRQGMWRVMWPKYPFAARALSFDFKRRSDSTGWTILAMYMLYEKANGSDKSMVAITPHRNCTLRGSSSSSTKKMEFTGEQYLQSKYDDYKNNFKDWSYDGRGHFLGGHSQTKYDTDYYCVGFAGVLTLNSIAGSNRQHGFTFNNLYLLPSLETSGRWCGGKATGEVSKKRLLLRDS